jgi:hypothetical protein
MAADDTIHSVAKSAIKFRREDHRVPWTDVDEAEALSHITDGPWPSSKAKAERAVESIMLVLETVEDKINERRYGPRNQRLN